MAIEDISERIEIMQRDHDLCTLSSPPGSSHIDGHNYSTVSGGGGGGGGGGGVLSAETNNLMRLVQGTVMPQVCSNHTPSIFFNISLSYHTLPYPYSLSLLQTLTLTSTPYS